jgi:cellulose synthase/poly-beta-1,6-N-acetylglucosamine synthase-like glycosyltransferase
MLKNKRYLYRPFSIVLPVLNEEKNIKKLILLIKKYLKNCKYELIFVDDYSKDNTKKIINNYGQNGLFWTNVLRQIVYIVAIILIIPLYTIQSLLLFTNMQEIKQVKGLWKEYEKFGNRDRFKETSFED